MLIQKKIVLDFINSLPELCSAEEILYSVQLLDEIAAGEEDAFLARFLPIDYVNSEVEKWLNQ